MGYSMVAGKYCYKLSEHALRLLGSQSGGTGGLDTAGMTTDDIVPMLRAQNQHSKAQE